MKEDPPPLASYSSISIKLRLATTRRSGAAGAPNLIPVEPANRIANITEPHPLRATRHAISGAVLGGGDMPERSRTVPQDNPDSRRVTPLRHSLSDLPAVK